MRIVGTQPEIASRKGSAANLLQIQEILERSSKEAFRANKSWSKDERLDYLRNMASKAYNLTDAQRSILHHWIDELVVSSLPKSKKDK
jgi:hypothetical protein